MRYGEWLRRSDVPIARLTNEIITAAMDGHEVQKARMRGAIVELRSMLPCSRAESAATLEPKNGGAGM